MTNFEILSAICINRYCLKSSSIRPSILLCLSINGAYSKNSCSRASWLPETAAWSIFSNSMRFKVYHRPLSMLCAASSMPDNAGRKHAVESSLIAWQFPPVSSPPQTALSVSPAVLLAVLQTPLPTVLLQNQKQILIFRNMKFVQEQIKHLSLIHIWRCRR